MTVTRRHPRLLVCSPVRFGLPLDPSTPGRCLRCLAEVWIPRRIQLADGDDVLCVVCAMSVVQVGDLIDSASDGT